MILLATADLSDRPFDDLDQPVLQQALDRLGIEARFERWDDPGVDWAAAHLVVLRSTWDYVRRLDDFLAWVDRVATVTALHNPPELVRWNCDKAYLGELGTAGIPVVPTRYVDRMDDLRAGLAEIAAPEVVLKPTVSAGSMLTGRFGIDDPALPALAATILADGRRVMVQPYLDSVTAGGETAVVFVDGVFSHALRKGPILDPGGPPDRRRVHRDGAAGDADARPAAGGHGRHVRGARRHAAVRTRRSGGWRGLPAAVPGAGDDRAEPLLRHRSRVGGPLRSRPRRAARRWPESSPG